MTLNKIGLNISALQNINLPELDIPNSTDEFINEIPTKANEITNGFVGVIILAGLFWYLYAVLSKAEFYGGDFGLSKLRATAASSAICSIFGLICLNLGYFSNYYHVVIFLVITFVSIFAIWKAEN